MRVCLSVKPSPALHNSPMHFFVHIPKTAGTSFRTAAERHFGADKVVYDYGSHSPVTSACIQRFLYAADSEDKPGLYRHWDESSPALVAGHKAVARFVDHVGLPRVLTFLREPLARSFSEYLHYCRDQRHQGSFREFFLKRPQNQQKRMCSKLPFQSLGFVGITERYDDSLRLLNAHFGWAIRKRRVNRAGWLAPGPDSISAEDRAEFYQRNAEDLALYQNACWLLQQRLDLHRQGLPFVHGEIESCRKGRVRGWAFRAGTDDRPVTIELHRNGAAACHVVADRPHKRLGQAGAPRAGQVAFAAQLPLAPEDRISATVADTGQPLCPEPLQI